MADYYPLIVRAIEGLADRSPETRRAVYDRARYALLGQLRSLDPPLSDDDIEHERKALEAAFVRIEAEHEAVPEPPPERPVPPAPARPAPESGDHPRAEVSESPRAPVARESDRAPRPGGTAAAPRERPPHPAAEASPQPRDSIAEAPSLRGQTRPRDAAAGGAFTKAPRRALDGAAPDERESRVAVKPREAERMAGAPPASAVPAPAAPSFPGGSAVRLPVPADNDIVDVEFTEAGPPLRPRVDTRSRVAVRTRRFPAATLGIILLAVIGAIAVAAWFLRDTPADLPRQPTVEATPSAPAEGPKLNERVGGQTPPPSSSALSQAPPARVEPGAPQRAVLYEEDPANPSTPKSHTGRVVWQAEALNAGQGQALDTAIRARVELPDLGFSLSLLIRRNLESTLPASHTVELAFTTPPGESGRVVRDVGLLQFKTDFSGRGTPVAGLTVPVRENVFLIGLSSIPGDVERNVEFMRRPWVDLPIRTVSGQRAVLSFEKGASGDQVVEDALRQWR